MVVSKSHRRLRALIEERAIAYGHPPNVRCCADGPAQDVIVRRVLGYFERTLDKSLPEGECLTRHGWVRDPALQIDIDPDWMEEP